MCQGISPDWREKAPGGDTRAASQTIEEAETGMVSGSPALRHRKEATMCTRRVMKATYGASVLSLLAITLLLGGCSSTQSAGEQVDDGWITSKVTAKLTADPEVNVFEIDVDSTNGVVRLSGLVDTDVQRREAAKLAWRTEGVRDVINDIRLGEQTVGETIDDSWISSKVKAKLAADPDVNKFDIDVDVLERVVTLSGTVKNDYARRHAGEIARHTKGVTGVKNRLKVE
jgi:hyperosmotically inducible protein